MEFVLDNNNNLNMNASSSVGPKLMHTLHYFVGNLFTEFPI